MLFLFYLFALYPPFCPFNPKSFIYIILSYSSFITYTIVLYLVYKELILSVFKIKIFFIIIYVKLESKLHISTILILW